MDSVIEFNFDVVDGALKEDHLLTLAHVVDLLVLGHFVIISALELVLAKSLPGKLNFLNLLLVFAGVEVLLLGERVDFSLALLAVKLAFSTLLISLRLKNLFCLLLSLVKRSPLPLFCFVGISAVFEEAVDIVEVILLFELDLSFKHFLEELDVVCDKL